MSVVGQDVVVAVHGAGSKVFGLNYDDDLEETVPGPPAPGTQDSHVDALSGSSGGDRRSRGSSYQVGVEGEARSD